MTVITDPDQLEKTNNNFTVRLRNIVSDEEVLKESRFIGPRRLP
jgi:hypothetical protein